MKKAANAIRSRESGARLKTKAVDEISGTHGLFAFRLQLQEFQNAGARARE